MSFYSQYELLEPVAGGAAKTFKARQVASGRFVMVHLLLGESAPLAGRVAALPPEKRAQVLDQGTHEGTPYVVTAPLPVGTNFEEWVGPAVPVAEPKEKDIGGRAGQWDVTRFRATLTGAPAPPA